MNDLTREAVEVPLTQGRKCFVSPEDADWALSRRWCATNGYPARGVGKPAHRVFYMHREIGVRAGMISGYDSDPRFIDHINRDKLDNRRENLRAVTHAENNCNRVATTASGLVGVYREKRPNRQPAWIAEVMRDGKRRRKYGFRTAEEAAAWRVAQIPDLGARF